MGESGLGTSCFGPSAAGRSPWKVTQPLCLMNKPAVLISTARIHAGSEQAFTAWQAKHSAAISKFPGFISTDMVPPPTGKPEVPWTIIDNFESEEALTAWKRSPERG